MNNDDKKKPDTAGNVHRQLYDKSDKVNACENQNKEFQEGYRTGASSIGYDALKVIEEEHALRKETRDNISAGFVEWKRGFWAARSQCILFVSPRLRRKCDKFFGEASDK